MMCNLFPRSGEYGARITMASVAELLLSIAFAVSSKLRRRGIEANYRSTMISNNHWWRHES